MIEFVYDVTGGGVQNLESVAVSTGRLTALTGNNGAVSFESDGFITDHLGNVAVVVNLSASSATSTDNVILEQNEYTPFGTKLNVTGLKTQAANRWRYAGKEEQDIAGMDLGLPDFGARYYDTFTCRWNAVDPLAHKYFPMSPYNYCGNDPVNFFDPDGRECDPVKNPKIRYNTASHLFGYVRRVFNPETKQEEKRAHQGFDYEAPVGTDVYTVKDGTVVDSGPTGRAYGTVICIEHKMDDGCTKYTFYAHLSETFVKVGDNVKEGDTIGKTGTTGNAGNMEGKDQHLHFEFRSKRQAPLGLDGRLNPNEIVPTKFTSQDPSKTRQKFVGVVKEDEDGTRTKMDID